MFQSQNQSFMGRRIEKVEMNEIIDAETLEHEDNIAEVDSLNLRDGILLQFVLVEKKYLVHLGKTRRKVLKVAIC